jgi:uncharacterized membrane protein YgdD (TMEM256/DUF423 family)
MDRKIITTAAFLGITAIILGAFGAHALKKVLNLEQLNTFETGVKYQMYHALFLLFVGLSQTIAEKTKKIIFYFIISGVIFFSGSIYLLATNNLTVFDFKKIGFITPIGGLLLIVGWIWLFIDFYKKKR